MVTFIKLCKISTLIFACLLCGCDLDKEGAYEIQQKKEIQEAYISQNYKIQSPDSIKVYPVVLVIKTTEIYFENQVTKEALAVPCKNSNRVCNVVYVNKMSKVPKILQKVKAYTKDGVVHIFTQDNISFVTDNICEIVVTETSTLFGNHLDDEKSPNNVKRIVKSEKIQFVHGVSCLKNSILSVD